MTREEAADYLRPIMENATLHRYQAALRLALEALEGRAEGPALLGAGTLDRSRWEGCKECTPPSCGTCLRYETRNIGDPCTTSCIKYSKHKPVNFCKNCGRPLTEEAWVELERRINRGTTDDA